MTLQGQNRVPGEHRGGESTREIKPRDNVTCTNDTLIGFTLSSGPQSL